MIKHIHIMYHGGDIMTEFERIIEKMKEQGIVPRIHYELMAIRALRVAAMVLVVAVAVWLISK